MPDALLQYLSTAALIDRKFQIDLRYGNITDALSHTGHIHVTIPRLLSLTVLILDDR